MASPSVCGESLRRVPASAGFPAAAQLLGLLANSKIRQEISTTSVIDICKYWHALHLNTCQYVSDVLACIVVCIVVCIGGMY